MTAISSYAGAQDDEQTHKDSSSSESVLERLVQKLSGSWVPCCVRLRGLSWSGGSGATERSSARITNNRFDDEPRPGFGFRIQFSEVLSYGSQGKELDSAKEIHWQHYRGPAGDCRVANESDPQCPSRDSHRPCEYHKPQKADKPQGNDGKGGDSVERKRHHFPERILGRSGVTSGTLVFYDGRAKPDQRNDAAQIKVDLPESPERINGPPAQEPIVRVVEYCLGAHGAQESVEPFCAHPLKEAVRRPALADTIDDIASTMEQIKHLLYRLDIVLQICIDADNRVALCQEEPRQESVLVTPVSR